MAGGRVRIGTVGLVLVGLTVPGCGPPSYQKAARQRHAEAVNVLSAGGPLADSYYACLLNGLAQGLPLSQIKDECAIKLLDEAAKELGADVPADGVPGGDIPAGRGSDEPFDPTKITASCHSGDPGISSGRDAGVSSGKQTGTQSAEVLGYKGSEAHPAGKIKVGKSEWEAYGYGSYGAKGKVDKEDGLEYRGLSKEQSMKEKADAIEAAEKALKAYNDAKEAAAKETDPAKKAELEKNVEKAKKAWQEAHDKANRDPNKKPQGTSRVTQEPSDCERALQHAREVLYECHRNGWRSAQCKELEAAMKGCPSPKQVYVDPDVGYACAPSIDAEALKNAWVERCQELKRFGPGGDDPCLPPNVDPSGWYAGGTMRDICKPGPQTYIEPGSDMCLTTVTIQPFGQPDIQKLAVWGLDKLGGPVVVFPTKDPSPPPQPGPEPRPAPP
jgi:hypothetical protein